MTGQAIAAAAKIANPVRPTGVVIDLKSAPMGVIISWQKASVSTVPPTSRLIKGIGHQHHERPIRLQTHAFSAAFA
jgi:hypothetical protein